MFSVPQYIADKDGSEGGYQILYFSTSSPFKSLVLHWMVLCEIKKKTQGYIFFILSLHSDSLSPKHWVSLYACVETGKALRPEGACDSGGSHWYHGPCSHYILCISQGIVRSRSQILTTPRVEGVSLEGNGPLLLII